MLTERDSFEDISQESCSDSILFLYGRRAGNIPGLTQSKGQLQGLLLLPPLGLSPDGLGLPSAQEMEEQPEVLESWFGS